MGSINKIPDDDIYQREDIKTCCSSTPLRYQGVNKEGYKIALWCLECGECSEVTAGSIVKYGMAADAAVIHWNNRINNESIKEYRV